MGKYQAKHRRARSARAQGNRGQQTGKFAAVALTSAVTASGLQPATLSLADATVDPATPAQRASVAPELGPPASVSEELTIASATAFTTAGSATPALPADASTAYRLAAEVVRIADPSCGLDWSVLAGIGALESGHGAHAPRSVDAGPDTDAGRLDADPDRDRPVGPLGFLPATWSVVGVDADGDGVRSPESLDDAALAAAVLLCGAPGSLSDPAGAREALRRFNPSAAYGQTVLALATRYTAAEAATSVPSAPAASAASAATTLFARELASDAPSSVRPASGDPAGSLVQTATLSPAAPTSVTWTPAPAPDREPTAEPAAGPVAAPETGTPAMPTTPVPDPSASPSLPDSLPTDLPPSQPTPPTPTEPTAGPTGAPAGGSDVPVAEPSGDPTASAAQAPTPVQLEGVLTSVDGQWWLDQRLLDVGDETWLAAPALSDLDGDGTLGSNQDELSGLVDTPVVMTVLFGSSPSVVVAVNGLPYTPQP